MFELHIILHMFLRRFEFLVSQNLPKVPIQEHRYSSARPIDNVADVFQPHMPVAGLDSTDVFGNLDARMAFNEMFSRHLRAKLIEYAKKRPQLEHLIIDGCVWNGKAPVMMVPCDSGSPDNTPDDPWCPHSEGDIGLSHWLAKFGHRTTLVHSADIDLQQVVLRVIQRWADSGLRPDQIAEIFLHKKAGAVVQTWNMKLYYQLVRSIFVEKNAAPDHAHPMDVWAMLTAASGNDFCAPWLCSPECARGEKDNDGIRLKCIWYAYVKDFRSFGPLFEPTTEADRWHGGTWSVFKCDTYVYPIRPVVAGWRALMSAALQYQQCRSKLKVANSSLLLESDRYVTSQLQRMTWSICYYANAALLGDRMPSGVELDLEGNSIHGWRMCESTNPKFPVSRADVTHRHPVLHALHGADAPTVPPTPDRRDPVEEFEELEGADSPSF